MDMKWHACSTRPNYMYLYEVTDEIENSRQRLAASQLILRSEFRIRVVWLVTLK
jgi:hypothetical protein